MAVTKEQTKEIIGQFRRDDLDTGSPEVQVALLTAKINYLTEHTSQHKHDMHVRIGLIRAVNRRRKLLDYLHRKDVGRYQTLIKSLEIRK